MKPHVEKPLEKYKQGLDEHELGKKKTVQQWLKKSIKDNQNTTGVIVHKHILMMVPWCHTCNIISHMADHASYKIAEEADQTSYRDVLEMPYNGKIISEYFKTWKTRLWVEITVE